MTDFAFDIVGFDLDGTLLDTSSDLTDAVNHALAAGGRPLLDTTQVKTMIGGGAKIMLQKGLAASGGADDSEFRQLYHLLLDYYEANIAQNTTPFPGALDALDALAARGVKLAICTNKFEHLADKLLRELGLRDRFAALIGGDTMGKGKAKPSPAPIHEMIARAGGGRAVFIGDSMYDILAAHNAGIPAIAVSFGFSTQPSEELYANSVINHYDELISALTILK